MEEDVKYLRIGTAIYKVVTRPCIDGECQKTLLPWRYSTLCQDEGKDCAAPIPKYDGFCIVPSHTHYNREINSFYNRYEPVNHDPAPGPFPHIEGLIHHIFEEQYELGLDYLQLLYLKPIQKLPILLLVSEERNTGKTTFLNFLKAVFQHNVTFNTNEDFHSKFNSDWAGKLLVMVDEVLLNRREDTERLKNLSTALSYKMEAKGKDRQEVEFFAKFVLCSNNESFPIIIDREETRFWVRKVHPLSREDPDYLNHLKSEIPAFLSHLQRRRYSTERSSRMWFSAADLHTAALDRIVRASRNRAESDLAELLVEMMTVLDVEKLTFCKRDLIQILRYHDIKMDEGQLRRILNDSWKLPHEGNAHSYTFYQVDQGSPTGYREHKGVGRFYTASLDSLRPFC